MSQVVSETEEQIEPVGQVRIVYLGPVEPHWDFQPVWGEDEVLEAFAERVAARLLLLPPHDPQFRRNRERVNRDGEREAILVDWDHGFPEETQEAAPAAPAAETA